MSKPKRIICYAINGAGLGHVTRLLSVAKWMRRYVSLLEGAVPEVLFLTSSDASDVLADAGFAAFKIPSKTIAKSTGLNKLEYRRLAKHFVWNTLGVFNPDLLVVDTFPSGSFDELFQVLDGPFKKSFLYRKVKPEYAARATFRSAASMYDTIVSPHSIQNCPVEQIGSRKVRCSGEVIQFDREDFLPRDLARKQLGIGENDRLVYLSAGGGGDPDAASQLHALVEGLCNVPNLHLLVGAGPLYRGPRLSAEKLTWYDGPSVGKYFAGLDAAICAAGYNTFHELMLAGVPTAFFAQPKIADDQAERIQTAVEAGACRQIDNLTDSQALVAMLDSLLDSSFADEVRQRTREFLPENNARRCALELLAPMYAADRLAWAQHVLTPGLAKGLEQLPQSTTAISDWLIPLMPKDQANNLIGQSVIGGVVDQLSDSAAAELRAVLATQEDSEDLAGFESRLLGLLEQIESLEKSQRESAANDLLKTILATMKKNPKPESLSWTSWVCDVIDCVSQLVARETIGEGTAQSLVLNLQLYRIFPRIIDASVDESFDLFNRFVDARTSANVPGHQISQSLQALKMTHQKVTASIVEESIGNFLAEADLHE